MRHPTTSKPRYFTAFRSAAEEVAAQRELIERLKLRGEIAGHGGGLQDQGSRREP
jgi:hypothetical protein